MSKAYLVLGADVEGLSAAASLAARGKDVHLIEAGTELGGAARAVELAPGHRVPGLYHDTALIRRKQIAGLNLEEAGLEWNADEPTLHALRGDGELLSIARNALGGSAESAAYKDWRAFVDRMAPLICEVLDDAPPEAVDPSVMDLFQLAKKGLRLRTLGEKDMMELMRIVTMPAWDWMEERFEDPSLRAALTSQVLPGTVVGPRAAGTTALMLMRESARGVEPTGGMAAMVDALTKRCEQTGVQIHRGQAVAQILIENAAGAARVSGVELENGTRITGSKLISCLDPKTTLLELLSPGVMPMHVDTEVEGWRMRGSSAVLLLATKDKLDLPGGATRLITAQTPEQLERAADALKYREFPKAPWLDLRDWTAVQGGTEGSTLSIHVHGVSHELAQGWSESSRWELRSRVLEALEAALPGVRDSIQADRLLTPVDLEQEFGLRGGHLHGGELVLDQLWVQRPAMALSRYETPLEGLFLGGASNHPGGPYFGGAGCLAAKRALAR